MRKTMVSRPVLSIVISIQLALAILNLPIFCMPVDAAVVFDGSMGKAKTLSGPKYQIKADLGKQVGANLFHSFSSLISTKGKVRFFPVPIQSTM